MKNVVESGEFSHTVDTNLPNPLQDHNNLCLCLTGRNPAGERIVLDHIPIQPEHAGIIKRISPLFLKDYLTRVPQGLTLDKREKIARDRSGTFMLKTNSLSSWFEEKSDPSEPRGVLARALNLSRQGVAKDEVLRVLEKAHERIPQNAKLCASYACRCYHLGYLGYAQYYLECSFLCAPYDPSIAGLRHCLLKKIGRKESNMNDYMVAFDNPDDVADFIRIVEYIENSKRFPVSYHEAALAPFDNNADYSDRYMYSRW
jgi:hypothetical protein